MKAKPNKKLQRKAKIIGGLRDFISFRHVNDENVSTGALDLFIDRVYENLNSQRRFYGFGDYQIEVSCNGNKLIIALHDKNDTRIEYMHLTCFKSTEKCKSYAHLTFIDKNKLRIYYNNDNVYSIGDLIKICEEIYYYIFTVSNDFSIISNKLWKNRWHSIFYVFIGCLYALEKNGKIFPKSLSSKASRKVLGVQNVEISPQKQKSTAVLSRAAAKSKENVKTQSPIQSSRQVAHQRVGVPASAPARSFR